TDGTYESFLSENTELPMMFMDDAIDATLQLMDAPAENITIRSSYNLGAMSFTPKEIAQTIEKHIPGFNITYNPDYRQNIADSWPKSIDDSCARNDWGWRHRFDLDKMSAEMILQLQKKYASEKK
ncbi:MAG TPA: NAD-dependent epimerase, partial [Aquaticitalea sp.]|nr:NAD-dependent epimerase [Aquaticitalea sp.]